MTPMSAPHLGTSLRRQRFRPMLLLIRWLPEHVLAVAGAMVPVDSKDAVDVPHSTIVSLKQPNTQWHKRMQHLPQLRPMPRAVPTQHLPPRMDQILSRLAKIAGPRSPPYGEEMMLAM